MRTSPVSHPPAAASNALDWSRADLWGPPERRPWTGTDLAWAALMLVLTNAAAAVPALWLLSNRPELSITEITYNPLVLTAGLLALWVVFAGYPAFVTATKGTRSLAHDFGWRFTRRDLLIGVAVGGVLRAADSAVGAAAGRIIDMSDNDNAAWLTMPRPVLWTAFFVVGASLIAPVLEELFFRGFVMRTIARIKRIPKRWVTLCAVIGSSILFGSMHARGFSASALYVPLVTGSLGAVLAFMTVRAGRLGPAVVTHIVFNVTGVALVLAA